MTFVDSHLRCPRDHKRLVIETGQDDVTGWVRQRHSCLHCGYSEIYENWPDVLPTRTNAAERLLRLRRGEPRVVAEWQYDSEAGGGSSCS